MNYKVTGKQKNSKMCFVCGMDNKLGLYTVFYEIENGELVGLCKTREEHQSYPGRVHGGIISALLDETIGRAVNITEKDAWGVTVELNIKFRKPIPLGEDIKVVGRITKNSLKGFSGTGEIVLENGDVAATATGMYMKLPAGDITNASIQEEMFLIQSENEIKEINV